MINEPTIILENASLCLKDHVIWHDASLSIKQGESIAILGPNGSGKTSFLRVLLGMLPLTKGKIQVLGQEPHRGNKLIGYVPQRRRVDQDLPIQGRQLVTMGISGGRWGFSLPAESRRERILVDEALDAVSAREYADRPLGQMSGGEQQRLLLAQALVGKPQLLLLDEPLANMDWHNQEAITQLIAKFSREQNVTVLMVTHDINPLLPCISRVIYLANGELLIGKPDEVITSERLTEVYGTSVQVIRNEKAKYLCTEKETTKSSGKK